MGQEKKNLFYFSIKFIIIIKPCKKLKNITKCWQMVHYTTNTFVFFLQKTLKGSCISTLIFSF